MSKQIASFTSLVLLLTLAACEQEEDKPLTCYEALVKEQGCGTVLQVLGKDLAIQLETKANGDTVLVNTFNLPAIYQVKGKKVYVSLKAVPKNEAPVCPGFTPNIYPHVKLVTVQETPCIL